MLIAGLMMAAKGFASIEDVDRMYQLVYHSSSHNSRGGVGTGIAAIITGRPGDAFAAFFGKKSHKVTDERAMKTVKRILEDPSIWLTLDDLNKIYLMALCARNTNKCIEKKLKDRSKDFLTLIGPTIPMPDPEYTCFDSSYPVGPAINNVKLKASEISSVISEMTGYDYYDYPCFLEQVGKKIMRRFF